MKKMKTKSPKRYEATARMSYIYKTTFKDGSVHYDRVNASKAYSPKTFINNLLAGYKHNSNNPLRQNMITDFERKVVTEKRSLKCEIVFSGTTEQCRAEKNNLVRTTDNCMNKKASVADTLGKKGKITVTVHIKGDKIKTMTSLATGVKMFFIDREYGYARGLKDNMIGYFHPTNPNFVQVVGLNIVTI